MLLQKYNSPVRKEKKKKRKKKEKRIHSQWEDMKKHKMTFSHWFFRHGEVSVPWTDSWSHNGFHLPVGNVIMYGWITIWTHPSLHVMDINCIYACFIAHFSAIMEKSLRINERRPTFLFQFSKHGPTWFFLKEFGACQSLQIKDDKSICEKQYVRLL